MTTHWIRIRARPQFCGPASLGTVDAVEVLRNALELNLAHAKAVIDAAVFDGQVARALAETEEQARTVARQIADRTPLGEPGSMGAMRTTYLLASQLHQSRTSVEPTAGLGEGWRSLEAKPGHAQ